MRAMPAALALGLGLVFQTSWAHHAFAMFDMNKTLVLDGTVKEFQWTNPHIWIELSVKNPSGEWQQWSVEGGYTGGLKRNGWRRDSFKSGDQVRITIHPLRDGRQGGSFVEALMADGTRLESFKNGVVLGEKTPADALGKPAP